MTVPSPSSVRGHADRELTIPLGRARTELVRALGEAGFALEIDQLTVLEGTRGSAFAGASRSADKLPLRVQIRLAPAESGCTLSIDVFDQWKLPVRRPAENYQTVIREVMGGFDLALRRTDPKAGEFTEPVLSGTPSAYAPAPTTGAGGQAIAKISGAANRYLEGGVSATQRRKGWQDTGSLVVLTPKASAVFDVDAAYAVVTVGTMVVQRPGGMPPGLVSQLEKVVGAFEGALQGGGRAMPTAFVELDNTAIPAVEFLTQQARIREKVAVRTLQVCTTCRLTKVVNPDYTKLKNKRHRTNILSGSIGAFVSPHGISPFVLVGRLAQLNQLDLEFVCPRCQGLHAESSLITFCPQCGDQRNDSVLRACEKCKFEFRALGATKDLWDEPMARPGPAPIAGAPAGGAPIAGAPAAWGPPQLHQRVDAEPAPAWAPPQPEQRTDAVAGPVYWGPPRASDLALLTPGSGPHPGGSTPGHSGEPSAPVVSPVRPEQQLLPEPRWYPDPVGHHQFRWWDGTTWTAHAIDGAGRPVVDLL